MGQTDIIHLLDKNIQSLYSRRYDQNPEYFSSTSVDTRDRSSCSKAGKFTKRAYPRFAAGVHCKSEDARKNFRDWQGNGKEVWPKNGGGCLPLSRTIMGKPS